MRKILLFLFVITIQSVAYSQNVTIYTVDRDDYTFSEVHKRVVPKEECEFDYKTVVLVYDRYLKEIIGGWGSYENIVPTSKDFRKIIDDAVFDMYCGKRRIRSDERCNVPSSDSPFDNILGLRWGMKLDLAVKSLYDLGLFDWEESDDNSILCIHKTAWNGVTYDAVRLNYQISNKQIKYLDGLIFMKMFTDVNKAKSMCENLASEFKEKYVDKLIKEEINEEGFKGYTVYEQISEEKSMSRVIVGVTQATDMFYAVVLTYCGWIEAARMVYNDNND